MDSQDRPEKTDDLKLIQAVIRRENAAWESFVRKFSDLIYSSCASVFSQEQIDAEYLIVFRVLQSDNFAILRTYNGRAPLTTLLTFKLREILGQRILELFKEGSDWAWNAFQRYFHKLLDQLKKRDEDLYQEICLRLIENNYRRILGFDGRGSFGAYVRKVIDNLCLDLHRDSKGRRRLPEGVQRLPALEQEIYKLLRWQGCRERDLGEILRDDAGNPYPSAQVKAALDRLQNLALKKTDSPMRETSLSVTDSDGDDKEMELPDSSYSPENRLLDAEQERVTAGYVATLREALGKLPSELALYVRFRYYSNPPKAPKEIARLMGRSEREIYRLRQDAIMTLKTALKDHGFEKHPICPSRRSEKD